MTCNYVYSLFSEIVNFDFIRMTGINIAQK